MSYISIETIEEQDQRELTERIRNLSDTSRLLILTNITEQVCWHGPVNREWLAKELSGWERIEERKVKRLEKARLAVVKATEPKPKPEAPVEDMFGSEIMAGDTWFKDPLGNVVLKENYEDYLIEVCNVDFFTEIE